MTTPARCTRRVSSVALSFLFLYLSQVLHVSAEISTPSTPTPLTDPSLCSCSPTVFTFVLSLDQSCDNFDIDENDGIGLTFCFLGTTTSSNRFLEEDDPVIEIVSVQFLEFDTSGELLVINQDDTYANVSLGDDDSIIFHSVSSSLNPDLPLEDQIDYVPGGVQLTLRGNAASGTEISNRVTWSYDNMNCGPNNDPVKVDDDIGWLTVGEVVNAWPAFCPALPAGSPTISPTMTPTTSPTVTPTKSPIATPKTASPTMSMPSKSSKRGKAKKAKAKKAKAKKAKAKNAKAKNAKSSKTVPTFTPTFSPTAISPTCMPDIIDAKAEKMATVRCPTDFPSLSPSMEPTGAKSSKAGKGSPMWSPTGTPSRSPTLATTKVFKSPTDFPSLSPSMEQKKTKASKAVLPSMAKASKAVLFFSPTMFSPFSSMSMDAKNIKGSEFPSPSPSM